MISLGYLYVRRTPAREDTPTRSNWPPPVRLFTFLCLFQLQTHRRCEPVRGHRGRVVLRRNSPRVLRLPRPGTQKAGKLNRMLGKLFGSAGSSTRALHGACVKVGRRNRTGRHLAIVDRAGPCCIIRCCGARGRRRHSRSWTRRWLPTPRRHAGLPASSGTSAPHTASRPLRRMRRRGCPSPWSEREKKERGTQRRRHSPPPTPAGTHTEGWVSVCVCWGDPSRGGRPPRVGGGRHANVTCNPSATASVPPSGSCQCPGAAFVASWVHSGRRHL